MFLHKSLPGEYVMKLTFGLNKAPMSVKEAYALCGEFWDQQEEMESTNPSYNPNQDLSCWVKDGLLTYGGERHPFIYDGAYDVVLGIFGDVATATVALVEYETSDPDMGWNQTKTDWVMALGYREKTAEVVKLLRRYEVEGFGGHADFSRLVKDGDISTATESDQNYIFKWESVLLSYWNEHTLRWHDTKYLNVGGDYRTVVYSKDPIYYLQSMVDGGYINT